MSVIFRPVQARDLPTYVQFAQEANFGFTTLPRSPRLVEKHLQHSLASFEKNVSIPGDEFYLFVAEDDKTKELLGISAILATTGGKNPVYYYQKESYAVSSHIDSVVKQIPILSPVSYVRSTSEVCSLYVSPKYQKTGTGTLLSFGRFLFMKAFMHRFTGTVFAELRGHLDHTGTNPFWEGVGRHFFTKPLLEVYDLLQYGKAFIPEFLPKYPIYQELLPQEVQDCLGKNDSYTEGALHLLQKIGFHKTQEIDIFDAGPKLIASKENITLIKDSHLLQITAIKEPGLKAQEAYVSTISLAFRACKIHCLITDSDVVISPESAELLECGVGDRLLIYRSPTCSS